MRITVTLRTDIEGKIIEKTAEAEHTAYFSSAEPRSDEQIAADMARALFESMSPQQFIINGSDGIPAAVATAKETGVMATQAPAPQSFYDWMEQNEPASSPLRTEALKAAWLAGRKYGQEFKL